MARTTFQPGDRVRYTGSLRHLHGLYEVVGPCALCPHCREGAARAVQAGHRPATRWRITDAERVITCVSSTSLTATRPGPCEDCGERPATGIGLWCDPCLDAWTTANG